MGIAVYSYLAVVLWVSVVLLTIAVLFSASGIRWLRSRAPEGGSRPGFWTALKEGCGLRRILWWPTAVTGGFLLVALVAGSAASIVGTNALRDAIRGADRLVIRTGGMCHRQPDRERVLFETRSPEVLRELAARLTLGRLLVGAECMCCGDMTFEYYRDGGRRGSFSYHHSQHIRIEDSRLGDRDLSILSNIRLLLWLRDHGVLEKLAVDRGGAAR